MSINLITNLSWASNFHALRRANFYAIIINFRFLDVETAWTLTTPFRISLSAECSDGARITEHKRTSFSRLNT